MTGPQILDVIESMTVPAREPETYPGGLTRRSWLYHSNPNTETWAAKAVLARGAKALSWPRAATIGTDTEEVAESLRGSEIRQPAWLSGSHH